MRRLRAQVALGALDAAIVYASDVATDDRFRAVLPQALDRPTELWLAVRAGAAQRPAVQRFLQLLGVSRGGALTVWLGPVMRSDRGLALAAAPMLLLLALPLVGLLAGAQPAAWSSAWEHPLWAPALGLSLRTSVMSVVVIVVLGTPAAWWLSQSDRHPAWQAVVDLPMVLPPAVIGLALLVSMSSDGLLGGASGWVFSTGAVVLAQVVVAAPFYLSAACAAFRRVDVELVWVARLRARPCACIFQGHAAACGAWAARRCGDGVGAPW